LRGVLRAWLDCRDLRGNNHSGNGLYFDLVNTEKMNHSSTIAAAVLIGFIVFVTVKGELPRYLAVIGL
jgi:hypothetical protein